METFRLIPSIEQLLGRPRLASAARDQGREAIAQAVRIAADDLRRALVAPDASLPQTAAEAASWIEARALTVARDRTRPSLRRVINATGVVIHTNLGRAPLAAEALAQTASVAGAYSNLEYDLAAGARGHRHAHAEQLLRDLTGAEAALVVNNAAAAALVVLAALAAGREVLVSRGELVEIGGGFRVPDVMAQSGARLREVGTTNRTRASDYAAAIGGQTAILLRVHPSNFVMTGFTERPSLAELASIARRFTLPLVEDLGSGWLGDTPDAPAVLADEPSVRSSLATGADLVFFSGDKLLGGPQAGIIVGRRDLIDRIRVHPLMRAVRAGKLTYGALEATLALWATPPALARLPVYRMLVTTAEEIGKRADRIASRLGHHAGLRVDVVDGASTPGGGSAPSAALPTRVLTLRLPGRSAASLESALRASDPPVVARIQDEAVVFDLRTVAPDDDDVLAGSIAAALAAPRT
jgi:L-seryl-tRNA(Ser) seleniumtransferase